VFVDRTGPTLAPVAGEGQVLVLHRAVLVLWRVEALVVASVVAVPLVATAVFASDLAAVVRATFLMVAVGGFGLAVWLPGLWYRGWSYRLADSALELQHGVLTVQRSVVPYFRVQHVDVSQGPLERALGLARLKVHTASAGTDASLPGVELERAEEVRRLVLDRAEVGDGV
jgi:membrane protein YdbS with pleckstrin-like domain